MKRTKKEMILIVILMLCIILVPVKVRQLNTKQGQWEYMKCIIPDNQIIAAVNSFGSDKWEMISVVRVSDDNIAQYEMFFKRPKQKEK